MKNLWRFTGNELKYIKEVLVSGEGSSTGGDLNARLEKEFAQKNNAKFGITLNSGTSTLHAALHAAGVGYGDEVIQPALTVICNAQVTLAVNAVPVFADIDPDTFNIDPDDIKRKITSRTKAIQVVPLYGLPCDYDPILKIADEHGLIVINDAAEALGATYKGRPIGSICPITSYSFENSKHISTGDGGIITADDKELALNVRIFAGLGSASIKAGDGKIRDAKDPRAKDKFQDPKYERCNSLGLNYRMPEVAAAIGLAQVERQDMFVNTRMRAAQLYDEVIKDCDWLVPQKVPEGYLNTYWTYVVKFERDDVSWYDFRHKYIDNGGDGIFAAWLLQYQEPLFATGAWKKMCPPLYNSIDFQKGTCPVAESIQPKLMQFVTNYQNDEEVMPQIEALKKTIEYFT